MHREAIELCKTEIEELAEVNEFNEFDKAITSLQSTIKSGLVVADKHQPIKTAADVVTPVIPATTNGFGTLFDIYNK